MHSSTQNMLVILSDSHRNRYSIHKFITHGFDQAWSKNYCRNLKNFKNSFLGGGTGVGTRLCLLGRGCTTWAMLPALKTKILIPWAHYEAKLMWRSSQLVLCCQLCLNCCVICYFSTLNWVKICLPPQKKGTQKSKVKMYVLNLSDKMKILDLLKGSMSLVEVRW
jgi:hypothetical protein